MTNTNGPPYPITRSEMRAIAANTDRAIAAKPASAECTIARMRVQLYLNHAGVPETSHTAAAAEASFRNSFGQDTEAEVARSIGRTPILRIVKPGRLDREQFPEHLIRTS